MAIVRALPLPQQYSCFCYFICSYDHEPFVGQCTWQSARWFVCETYFYRKIRAIMKAHNGPVDPFSAQKQSLLDSLGLPFERHVLALMKSNSTISEAISQSLLGNKGDLVLLDGVGGRDWSGIRGVHSIRVRFACGDACAM